MLFYPCLAQRHNCFCAQEVPPALPQFDPRPVETAPYCRFFLARFISFAWPGALVPLEVTVFFN